MALGLLLTLCVRDPQNARPGILEKVPRLAQAAAAGFLALAGIQAFAGHALLRGGWIGTVDVHGTAQAALQLLTCLGFFVLCAEAFEDRRLLERTAAGLAAAALLLSVAGTAAGFRESSGHVWWMGKKLPVVPGSFGFFSNENHFGGFAVLVLPLVGAAAWHAARSGRSGLRTYGMAAAACFAAAAVVVAEARVAAVVFFGALAAVAARAAWNRKLPFRVLAGCGLLAAAAVVWTANRSLPGHFGFASLKEAAALRIAVMRESLGIFSDHPLFGTGLGTYRWVSQGYVSQQAHESVWWNHAHNDYVELLAETGLAGAALCLLAAGSLAAAWLRNARAADSGWARTMGAQALLAVAGFALLEAADFHAKIPALALLLALQAGVLTALQPPRKGKNAPSRRARFLEKCVAGALASALLVSSAALAVRTGPSDPSSWHADGRAKIAQAERATPEQASVLRKEAICSLRNAARSVPTHPAYWLDLGSAELLWGDRSGGLESLERAARHAAPGSLYGPYLVAAYLFCSDRAADPREQERLRARALLYYAELRDGGRLPSAEVQKRTMGAYYFDRLQNRIRKL